MSVKHDAYLEKTSALGWQILDCKQRINGFRSKKEEKYDFYIYIQF